MNDEKRRRMMKRAVRWRSRGFTLVELILVIVIIGILAGIILPKFAGQTDQAKIATAKSNLSSLRAATRMFAANNNGTPPGTLAVLVPTYMRAIPKEPITPSNAEKAGAPDGTGGWAYDSSDGTVLINLTGNDANGDPYSGY
jgi:general secretion pathway protein G